MKDDATIARFLSILYNSSVDWTLLSRPDDSTSAWALCSTGPDWPTSLQSSYQNTVQSHTEETISLCLGLTSGSVLAWQMNPWFYFSTVYLLINSALSTILLEVTPDAPAREDSLWNKICTSDYAGRMIGFLCQLHRWAHKVAVSLRSVSWLADLSVLQTKNARLPGSSTDSQQLIDNF